MSGRDTTAKALAERSAGTMWAADEASRRMGMTLVTIDPGAAVLEMTIDEAKVNGHGIAHGGFVFALADSAFAVACNSHGDRAVAAQCHITYLQPAQRGDRLVATAREVARQGRSGIYDVRIACGERVVAEFRGHSRLVPGSWLDAPAPAER